MARPPSVERVLGEVRAATEGRHSPEAMVAATRTVLAEERAALSAGEPAREVAALAAAVIERLRPPDRGPVAVINATGVILHTNLGRAPWPRAAIEAATRAASGALFLELERDSGRRGRRYRAAEDALMALTGAEDALVTNNNAAALVLAVGLAGRNGRVIVSRGELLEIGGGVRIPDVIRRAGARLVEVGTTNRTRVADFAAALDEGRAAGRTQLVLRVHQSNVRLLGFTEAPDPAELARAAHERDAVVVDDLGSGALLDTSAYSLAHEPGPAERLLAGADLVTFSGDKLVGGPQAGLIAGRADLIERLRRDPLARALRPDKVTLAAVAATLELYRSGLATTEIPVWRMIATPAETIRGRVGALVRELDDQRVECVPVEATIGGGSLPGETLPSFALALHLGGADRVLAALRTGDPAVMGRVADRRVLLDLRTVDPADDHRLAAAVAGALARGARMPRSLPGPAARMTVVVGTAGHIDHGKTTLLRTLTGIDADRLPDEQRRGMTIDVGYAHLQLPDGAVIDFVDVPGHDRLIGNMLVGAGEIDAAMLVVAADDGPNRQTIEHLELLDAIGIVDGLVVVTKTDLFEGDDPQVPLAIDEVRSLVARTTLAGAPVVAVSSITGAGIAELVATLSALRERVAMRIEPGAAVGPGTGSSAGFPRLAIDRSFSIRGRGAVATGSLRGGSIAPGDTLRLEPGGRTVRIREVQVHGQAVERAERGRVAVNLVGADIAELRRGGVLAAGPAIEASDRLLVALRPAVQLGQAMAGDRTLRHGMAVRVHLGTEQVDGTLDLGRRVSAPIADPHGRARLTALIRLERPIAVAFGDSIVVRRPSPGDTLAGGVVLDPRPPAGLSRRRSTPDQLGHLALATAVGDRLAALVSLHGIVAARRADALAAAYPKGDSSGASSADGAGSGQRVPRRLGTWLLDPELAVDDAVVAFVGESAAAGVVGGASVLVVRAQAARELRRRASIGRDDAAACAAELVDRLVEAGRLARHGDRLLPAGQATGPSPVILEAMGRLEQLLSVAAPPALSEAARLAGCPPDGIRALESSGRIVRLEDDLAWAAGTFRDLEDLAVRLAMTAPLSPAAFRDATGTSRRYALAIIEELDRRAVLRRTPAGHVPGARARLPELAP